MTDKTCSRAECNNISNVYSDTYGYICSKCLIELENMCEKENKKAEMRKLSEIIQLCKEGKKPTIDEARLAICAMDSLMVFDGLFHSKRASREMEGKKPDYLTAVKSHAERFNRVKNAMSKNPVEWLGNYNPDLKGGN